MVVKTEELASSPEAVYDLIASEAGREQWLEPDPDRQIRIESETPPGESGAGRISWWWWTGDEAPRHVEIWVVAISTGTRVIAIESAPSVPLTMLARCATGRTVIGV